MIKTYLSIAIISYLLGSIPFGYILVRIFRKQDIRTTGSGNIGATNVARSGAKGLAVATLLLDAAKGFAAVIFAARWWTALHGPPLLLDCWLCTTAGQLAMFAALMAVIGHMFPVWLGFKGGKGVATSLGALIIIDPVAVGVTFGVFIVVVGFTRYVSLGSVVAAASFPAVILYLGMSRPPAALIWPLYVISILIIIKHHANIRRLLAGTESRLGARPAEAAGATQDVEKQA